MEMQLRPIRINPELSGYIEKMWVFESTGRVPDDDMKLIVPNGLIKMVIPFRNGLFGSMEGWSHLSKEHSITIIGMCDRPSIVDTESDDRAGTIGIEFSPQGAYRFFQLPQRELTNRIYNLGDVLGTTATTLEQRIAGTPALHEKIQLVESFLISLFRKSNDDNIFHYCVNRIRTTVGMVAVKDLEKETGYSSRWLNMKFDQRIGISPKNLCAITRFQYCYQALAQSKTQNLDKRGYGLYYDQSHFIKEFKRFTGVPPKKFEDANNEFGKIFYRT